MGIYFCIASNGVPPSVSKRVAVTVLCKLHYSSFLSFSLTSIRCRYTALLALPSFYFSVPFQREKEGAISLSGPFTLRLY